MKEYMSCVWYFLAILVVIAIISVFVTALNGTLYPWWLSIQRKAVENSKSFIDANNNMLANYMLEYSRLDVKSAENPSLANVYNSQQMAIIDKMCRQIATMKRDTVNPDVLTFIDTNGGCK